VASYEKVVKYVTERFETALTPLQAMIKNQEIIIVQNRQIVELLEKIRLNGRLAAGGTYYCIKRIGI